MEKNRWRFGEMKKPSKKRNIVWGWSTCVWIATAMKQEFFINPNGNEVPKDTTMIIINMWQMPNFNKTKITLNMKIDENAGPISGPFGCICPKNHIEIHRVISIVMSRSKSPQNHLTHGEDIHKHPESRCYSCCGRSSRRTSTWSSRATATAPSGPWRPRKGGCPIWTPRPRPLRPGTRWRTRCLDRSDRSYIHRGFPMFVILWITFIYLCACNVHLWFNNRGPPPSLSDPK